MDNNWIDTSLNKSLIKLLLVKTVLLFGLKITKTQNHKPDNFPAEYENVFCVWLCNANHPYAYE
jgi:hypothetical protein